MVQAIYEYDTHGNATIWEWPIGDLDRNADVDDTDGNWLDSIDTPDGTPTDYPFADLDADGDVDSADLSTVQNATVVAPVEFTYSGLDNPYLFTGRETDAWHADNLLVDNDPDYQRNQWNRNRNYDPKHGRWFQRDPLGVRVDAPSGTIDPPKQYMDGMNGYEYVKSQLAKLQDPMGRLGDSDPSCYEACMAAGEHTPSDCEDLCDPEPPVPGGSDCGIEIHQSPYCLFGGAEGGQLGHTWLTWGDGSTGNVADCPANYINGRDSECQKNYVNNKWHVAKVSSGSFEDGGRTRSCSSASCADIKQCLHNKMGELCPRGSFNKETNNCRQFVGKAMSGCCLERGGLFDVDIFAPLWYCCSSCARHYTGVGR